MLNLNIGAGLKIRPRVKALMDRYEGDWTLADFYRYDNVTIFKQDARKLTYEDETLDTLLACHLLEHFHRTQVLGVLEEWFRVLKSGGHVVIEVPDIIDAFRMIEEMAGVDMQTWEDANNMIYGGIENQSWHGCCFTRGVLVTYLHLAGFVDIKLEDYRGGKNKSIVATARKP